MITDHRPAVDLPGDFVDGLAASFARAIVAAMRRDEGGTTGKNHDRPARLPGAPDADHAEITHPEAGR